MSVPLDRLYNFLHNVCNRDDVVIYRFFPHGSKKSEDLKPILDFSRYSWLESMTIKSMVCHDQEPLNYDLYSEQDFYPKWPDRFSGKLDNNNVNKLIASMNFRALIETPFNGNDQVLLCHSEKNSKEVERYEQNNFIGVYYWSHALISRDWFRYAKLDPKLTVDFDQINLDFLIYNRAWSGTREYRLMFIEMLLNQNLQEVCRTTFSEMDTGSHYSEHVFKNQNLSIVRKDIQNYFNKNTVDATSSADYNNVDYAESAIEVVLETLFDDSRHHLTEKTLRPIACGRPFILLATPYSLQYLREYGFETFGGLIDESYDTILDPKERLAAIVNEMQRIKSLDQVTKRRLWEQLYKISARNKELFFSDHWHNIIISEFKSNVELATQRMTSTGKYWKQLEQLIAEDPEKQKMQNSRKLSFRTAEDLAQFRLWLTDKRA